MLKQEIENRNQIILLYRRICSEETFVEKDRQSC